MTQTELEEFVKNIEWNTLTQKLSYMYQFVKIKPRTTYIKMTNEDTYWELPLYTIFYREYDEFPDEYIGATDYNDGIYSIDVYASECFIVRVKDGFRLGITINEKIKYWDSSNEEDTDEIILQAQWDGKNWKFR